MTVKFTDNEIQEIIDILKELRSSLITAWGHDDEESDKAYQLIKRLEDKKRGIY